MRTGWATVIVGMVNTKWKNGSIRNGSQHWQDMWSKDCCNILRKPDGAFLKFAEGMFKGRAARGRPRRVAA